MEQIILIKRNGDKINLFSREPFCVVKTATQESSLMADDSVKLTITSEERLVFAKGDKIQVGGYDYKIRTTVTTERKGENHYEYSVTLYGGIYDLMKTLYRDTDAQGKSTRSTFDLTYTLKEFMRVMIFNLERDYPGEWIFDEESCPDTEPFTHQFNTTNCLAALQTLCKECDVEFMITQENSVRTIHIGKFGAKINPPGGEAFFQWGKDKGLYSLKEDKVDDKAVITRLWVEGGTGNLPLSYRGYSERLQLPYPRRLNANRHVLRDGTVIEPQTELIGISDDEKRYFEDPVLRDALGSEEDAKIYDEIQPSRTGSVTAVTADINQFVDNTMDFDLNEKDSSGTIYLVNGANAKITFLSGLLAGQEFELSKYSHDTKTFTLIPYTDERGVKFPSPDSEAFRMQVGDKYKITDIMLPQQYVDNAEEDLWYEGKQDFDDAKQARAQYSLSFDRMYFLDNNLADDASVCLFHVGDYVPIKDERFGIEKYIRIQKISRDLLKEHSYTLTIADTATISVATQTVLDVRDHNTIIENNRLRDLNRARKGWRTTEELRNMVYDPDGYFDTDNIKPNSIDTNMLTVGSKSQQFVLTGVILEPNVSGNANRFNAGAGLLSHLSLEKTDLPAALVALMEKDGTSIPTWSMSYLEFTLNSSGGYYLYARCSKKSFQGNWYMSQEQIKSNPEGEDFYYFQVGILSSVYADENFRDFVSTYGFTRINGNTITTGRIITSDGMCYLDLDGNKFRIGDSNSSIDWNVTAKGQLTLQNVRLLSGSGDSNAIGVFRGTWNASYVYYYGDEVTYEVGTSTRTYRYINETPSVGHAPTDSNYWAIVAAGADGKDGTNGSDGKTSFYTFNDSVEKPTTPTGDGNSGGWHTASSENVRWMSIKVAKTITDGTWGAPIKVRGADGTSISIKGTVTSVSQLPMTGNKEGDCYILNGYLYVWDGVNWQNMGKIQGDPGSSSYLHKKYSDDGGQTFTAGMGETPGRYLGLYVDQNPTDSDDPARYTWSDTKGEQGTPGEPGEDGKTTYLHIKYSDDGGMTFTADNGEEPGSWIGQYTDYELMDSNNPGDYTWARIQGSAGNDASDAEAGYYYEYRYAKNGSLVQPPTLDDTAAEPTGWSKEQPKLGALEYLWSTIAKKSALLDREIFHIPVNASDYEKGTVQDVTGNGYNLIRGEGTVKQCDRGYCLELNANKDSRIPFDLPFGTNFTLCMWIKTDQNKITWLLNGYNGREYVEKTISLTANSWYHFAFRFANRTLTVFQDGSELGSWALSDQIVGFSVFDDNIFGSTFCYDEIRCFKGALAAGDINRLYNGEADRLLSNWSVPIRVTPYDGKDGAEGSAGISVDEVDVEYAISNFNTIPPVAGWQTDPPTWVDGKYIWSRTKVSYSDSTCTYTDPVCITGGRGASGSNGKDGQDGSDGQDGAPGVGIKSIKEQYYLSSSPTTLADGSWSDTRYSWRDGWYMWTRSVIEYTDGTSMTTSPICVTGASGITQGNNLLRDTGFTAANHGSEWDVCFNVDAVIDGTGGQKAVRKQGEKDKTYTDVISQTLWEDGSENALIEPSTWYTLSFWSQSKEMDVYVYPGVVNTSVRGYVDGVQKNLPADGRVSFFEEEEWTFHQITFATKGTFSGTYGRVLWRTYQNRQALICMPKLERGTTATAWCMNEDEKKGNAGVSVEIADVEYAINDDPETAPEDGWQTESPVWEDGKFIWSRTRVDYSDGSSTYTSPVNITGKTGATGATGNGIASITEEYYRSTSSSVLTGGSWSTTRPTWVNGTYLWTRSRIKYTDGSESVTTPICVTGARGVTGTTYYTWIKYADDENGGGMSDSPVDAQGNLKAYIGFAYNQTTATEGTDPTKYKWALFKGTDGSDGIDGAPGVDGQTYYTWIKYADSLSSSGYPTTMYDSPKSTTQYIGIAVNKTTPKESDAPGQYTWSKFKGDDGVPGKDADHHLVTLESFAYNSNSTPNSTASWDGVNKAKQDGRGTMCVLMSPDGTVQETKTSDTYTDGASEITSWLNNKTLRMSPGTILMVLTRDACCIDEYFATQLAKFGGNVKLRCSQDAGNARTAFVFVGKFGDSSGRAVCEYATGDGATAKIDVIISCGTILNGQAGKDGDSVATVYRGAYDSSKLYYGTPYRVDVVKYNGVYYVARVDAGDGFTAVPTDTEKWNPFGAQFESVATQLLLAEYANIGNMIIKNNCIISQKGKVNGAASDDYTNANFVPNIKIDGKTGKLSVMDGVFYGSLAEPPVTLGTQSTINLDFSTGFNFAGWSSSTKNLNLPTGKEYNGVRCKITNTNANSQYFKIKCVGGGNFYYSTQNASMVEFAEIHLYGVGTVELRAVLDNSNNIRWFVENFMDFAYDWSSKILSNGIRSPYMRLIDIFTLNGNSLTSVMCADGNAPKINSYNKGGQWWTIGWTKSRSGHKKKYYAIAISQIAMFPYCVRNVTDASFEVGFTNNGFITLSSDGSCTVLVFEY